MMKLVNYQANDSDNIVIINTCAVTQEAERQSKQVVRKAIRENGDSRIIVTGCAARTSKDYFENLDGVSEVIQNADKEPVDISQINAGTPHLFDGRARAFLQIQNGCDHFCTYCIVPFTRGRSRSLLPDIILKQVDYFLHHGFNEIVLSGIDIASYGKDIDESNHNLATLIETILEKTHTAGTRIRLSSIDPAAIDQNLLNLFTKESRIMPYFHFSIQSGSNEVLMAMRRRHSREDVIAVCENIRRRRNGVVIGGDLIAGFPTETKSMFEESVSLIDDAGLSLIHVFPYSARSGTIAAQMINLPSNVVRSRAAKLHDKAHAARRALHQSLIGTTTSGLIEKSGEFESIGKTDSYIPFRLDRGEFRAGDVVHNLTITGVSEDGSEMMLLACLRRPDLLFLTR
jgi:threonylcarbamoyladenosine tRNA methylthiotransferase MtaB